jgi:hypothetical protein
VTLRSDGYASPFEHAWTQDGSPARLVDPVQRLLPDRPAPSMLLAEEACPGRTCLAGQTYAVDDPPALTDLLPVALDEASTLEGEIDTASAQQSGREARWVNATFTARLEAFVALPDGDLARERLDVTGTANVLLADGVPAPVQRQVTLDVDPKREHGAFDASLSWTSQLVGYRAGQPTDLASEGYSAPVASDIGLSRTGPEQVHLHVAFPFARAMETLEDHGSAMYEVYRERHPDAYLTRAHFDPSVDAENLAKLGVDATLPADIEGQPGWTFTFEDRTSTYQALVVREDRSQDPGDAAIRNATGSPQHAWDRVSHDRTDDVDGPGTPIPFAALPARSQPPKRYSTAPRPGTSTTRA